MGLRGDKRNTVRATLCKTGDETNPLYEVEGQWSGEFVFRDVRTNEELETYDTNKIKATPLIVAPLEEQDPWESRRAWSDVIKALQAGDMQGTSAAKSIIEKAQRVMRKEEEAARRKWEPLFFSRVANDPAFQKLAAPHGKELRPEMTNGIWRFDQETYRKTKVPFHGDLIPSGPKQAA